MSPGKSNHGLLAAIPAGQRVRITGVEGGARVQSRLIGMGLIAGVSVDVRSNDGGGPILLAVRHSRIALGRGMAQKVRVEPVLANLPRHSQERHSA